MFLNNNEWKDLGEVNSEINKIYRKLKNIYSR